jgi:hypothetical protein
MIWADFFRGMTRMPAASSLGTPILKRRRRKPHYVRENPPPRREIAHPRGSATDEMDYHTAPARRRVASRKVRVVPR